MGILQVEASRRYKATVRSMGLRACWLGGVVLDQDDSVSLCGTASAGAPMVWACVGQLVLGFRWCGRSPVQESGDSSAQPGA